jgi:hypothetical protein
VAEQGIAHAPLVDANSRRTRAPVEAERDRQRDTRPAHPATMGVMGKGLWGRLNVGMKPVISSEPKPLSAEPEPRPDAAELHFCCICGALLGFDFEDEVDGEGPGRDICSACNRTRNDDSIMFGW